MNHLFRVILVLSLAALGVAALILYNHRANPRPAQQLAVEAYVAYRHSTNMRDLKIKEYVAARMPQHFRPEMSRQSFSDGLYYAVDQSFNTRPTTLTWPSSITVTSVSTLTQPGSSGGKPLPYPPNDLWCAQLSSADPAAPEVVLVGLHQDIYNAEWVVHEVADPDAVLPAIGCQFSNH